MLFILKMYEIKRDVDVYCSKHVRFLLNRACQMQKKREEDDIWIHHQWHILVLPTCHKYI